WYLAVNRGGPAIDSSGFDLSAVQHAARPAPAASAAPPSEAPPSSLAMLKGDAGVRIGDSGPAPAAPAAAAASGDKKAQSHEDFTQSARKHESDVRNYSIRMTQKYPILRQYGKDWMSHPDLKKLNDDYMRNHDPIAFIMGLTKAPSLGVMVKQYAGNPAITSFITGALKEAPADLTSSAMDVLANDKVAKSLISNVASGLGLPPSVTGLINSGGDASQIDQKKIVSDMMNSPAVQNAMPQGQQAPPVSLSR
ncbi:MAG TPA: hypothetical protein VN915_15200, partial [Elusimicrobiota bacterium]|nr:hypothetical protein [Elusimicrobiota bacterium]